MGISFKKLAQAAAKHAVTELSDAPLDESATATVEAKGLEALAQLKAEVAAEEKAFLATPEGVRKALIAKRAGQARLAAAAVLADITGQVTTVQARRGADMREGKGETRRQITPAMIVADLNKLLTQPGALKLDIRSYNPAAKGAKPAPAPLLALRTLEATLAAQARIERQAQAKAG